jgi:glycosyltransferase involved in cell wall biosynthesis
VFVNARARHWRKLDFGRAQVLPVEDHRELLRALPAHNALVFSHTPLDGFAGDFLATRHRYIGFAHQPLYLKLLAPYRKYRLVLGVSEHVLASVRSAGLPAYARPLYGVGDVDRLQSPLASTLERESRYAWDRRKLRDCTLAMLSPLGKLLQPRQAFHRKPGLTLGIVSRLVGMKQFPELFSIIAPILRGYPDVNLEIFGSGGYAAVRDLKRSLAPMANQVRFWGHQDDVRPVYAAIDFLLTGLPEREGMGRNALEAQLCGTPVLAIDAPPFNETVLEGRTGFLYRDPREDGGADFERHIAGLRDAAMLPDPLAWPQHLARFTQPTFTREVAQLLERIDLLVPPLKASRAAEANAPLANGQALAAA